MRNSIALFVAGSLVAMSSMGQEATGYVVDTEGRPVEDALVTSLPDSITVSTDAQGAFALEGSRFLIRKIGFKTQIASYPEGDLARIILEGDPVLLSAYTISVDAMEMNVMDFPGSVEVISPEGVKKSNPTLIANALNLVPGIYTHSGTMTTNRITIRGIGSRSPFSTNKIRAYYEDIPLTNGSGETTIEDIDIGAIGSIEVIKGPNSSIYGSGLGGTINIKQRKDVHNGTLASSDFSVGSFGLIREAVGLAHKGPSRSAAIRYSYLASDGYRENNETERHAVMTNGQVRRDDSKLTAIGYYVRQEAFIPSSLNLEAFREDPRSAAFTWRSAKGFEAYDAYFAGISFEHLLSSQWTLTSSLFNSFKNANEPRPFNILDDQTFGIGLRSRLLYEPSTRFRSSVGIELFGDEYKRETFENLYDEPGMEQSARGDQLSELVEDRSYLNFFGQFYWLIDTQWELSGGLNLNRTSYALSDGFNPDSSSLSSSFRYQPQLSPRLALIHYLRPGLNIYASMSHGFSPPTLEETLTPYGQVNPDIRPETGWNYEVGAKGSGEKFSYTLTLFKMDISNLLVARRTGQDQYVGINAGNTEHRGVELSARGRWVERGNAVLTSAVSYSFSDFVFSRFVDDENDFSGNQLTGVPKHELNIESELSFYEQFFIRPVYRFVSEIPVTDDNTVYAPAYYLLDLQARWEKELTRGFSVEATYTAYNVTGTHYASMLLINAVGFGGSAPRYYYPGMPFNQLLRIRLNYRL